MFNILCSAQVIVTKEGEEYDLSSLISDIGGQLGVWIGLSVITAAEVVELIAMLTGRATNRKRRERKRRRRRTDDDVESPRPTEYC